MNVSGNSDIKIFTKTYFVRWSLWFAKNFNDTKRKYFETQKSEIFSKIYCLLQAAAELALAVTELTRRSTRQICTVNKLQGVLRDLTKVFFLSPWRQLLRQCHSPDGQCYQIWLSQAPLAVFRVCGSGKFLGCLCDGWIHFWLLWNFFQKLWLFLRFFFRIIAL